MKIVYIKESSKIQYVQGFLVVTKFSEELKVFLDEVKTIFIESARVAITMPLLIACIQKHIEIIFCDQKHNPIGTINNFNQHSVSLERIKSQFNWPTLDKENTWMVIVKMKIMMQSKHLRRIGNAAYMQLENIVQKVQLNDKTNKEGLAAKLYFSSMFGPLFKRHQADDVNKYLNYGYTILLSMFNRRIKILGYLTQIGIHHKSNSNLYNLSSDLMEPFRVFVDAVIYTYMSSGHIIEYLRKLSLYKIKVNNQVLSLENAIRIYLESVFNYLNNKHNKIESFQMGFYNEKNINHV